MAKPKVLPKNKRPAWKCPTCRRWIREEMSRRCSSCRKSHPIQVVASDEDDVDPTVFKALLEYVAVTNPMPAGNGWTVTS